MIKVITAIGDSYINNKLKSIEGYEVIGKDIQYQEGIIEYLEEINEINMIILSDNIIKEFEFYTLISKIQKIKKKVEIIVILKNKNENIENFLNSKQIYKIYYLDNIEIFFKSLKLKNSETSTNIFNQIEEIKNMIKTKKIEKSEKIEINKSYVNFNNIINENNYQQKKFGKIIVISGYAGVGKSIFSIILSNIIKNKNIKTLLISLDENSSVSTVLGTYKKNKKEDSNYIINYKNNLDLLLESNFEQKEYYVIEEFIMKVKEKYSYIIIDISSNNKYTNNSFILKYANKIVFLMEPHILGIKKAKILLETYIVDWKIDSKKIKIVFIKSNKYQISKFILDEIFEDLEVVGNILYSESYYLFINKNANMDLKKEDFYISYEKIFNNLS